MNKLGQIGKYSLLRRRWPSLVLSVLVPLILLTVVILSASAMEAEPAGQMEPQTGGGFNSAIQVTNISYTATTDIAVDYSDGINVTETGVLTGESVTFLQEWEGHDPGWAGGATIASSGEQIVALVSQHASDADKESIYNAFGFYDAPTSLVLPALFKNYSGLNSTVFVQNVGEGTAAITVNYSDGVVRTDTITPGGTAILPQAEEAHVDQWFGSALINADQPIVAVVNVESETVFRTYRGFAQAFGMRSALSQTGYQYWLPIIKKTWGSDGDNTGILVYNLDFDFEATIMITYYDQDGLFVATDTGTIPPGESISYYQGANAELPDGFLGSAVISSDQPIVALVGQQALDSSYYEDFSEGVYDAVLPLVQKAYHGCDTQIAIQNTDVMPVDVDVVYVGEADGTPVQEWEYVYGLPPNASVLLEQAGNADLPEMFLGHAKVDATGAVAVVVNRVCSGTLSTYNGVDLEMAEDEAHAPAVMYEYQPGGADEVQLTVNVEPPDAESAGCYVDRDTDPPYAPGDVVELTATPCTGWVFDYWSGDAAVTGTLVVTMDSSKVVTAHFSAEGTQDNFIGSVLYPSDLPVPDVTVEIHDQDWGFWNSTTTDESGAFAFGGLEAGVTYTVDFFLPDTLAADWQPPDPMDFTLASPDDQVEQTFYLKSPTCDQRVVGEVVDESGTPVNDAWVFANHETSGLWVDAMVDEMGQYQICLGDGLWRMGVEPLSSDASWHFPPDQEQWVWFSPTVPATKTVNFTVKNFNEDFFDVTGLVTTTDGSPLWEGAVWIDLCADDGACWGGSTTTSGEFSFKAPPGIYELWIWVDSTTGWSPPSNNGKVVDVDEDPEDLGTFYLRGGNERSAQVLGSVIITPTDPTQEGVGLGGVEIEAWSGDGAPVSTETISDGTYVLNVYPGFWHGGPVLNPDQEDTYVVLPPRYRSGYVAEGGTATDVDFYLRERDAIIRGNVVGEDGDIITDAEALVFADLCSSEGCWTVDEYDAKSGFFSLKVVGGYTYTLSVEPQSGGYMPGPSKSVFVDAGDTLTGTQLTLIDAGTRLWGKLRDGDSGELVNIDASVYAVGEDGRWVEDTLWPDKDPYQYELYVPTPETGTVTWTLGLWVDPSTGYVADQEWQDVAVDAGEDSKYRDLYVKELDTLITGTVGVVSADTAIVTLTRDVWVYAESNASASNEALYFEAKTDAQGVFTMPVLPGNYRVSAYLPERFEGEYLPPSPVDWSSEGDNPVELRFRRRSATGPSISGDLTVEPAGAIPEDAPIHVFGWADDGSFSEVTGTLKTDYHMPAAPETVWHLWAVYEDLEAGVYYSSQEKVVSVGETGMSFANLKLEKAEHDLPETSCWTFDPSSFKRLSLPAWGDLPSPLVEIQAGTMPTTDTVEVCATPKIALPDGQYLIGFGYEMKAWDSTGKTIKNFNKKVRFIFYFNKDAIPAGADPEELRVVYYSTAKQDWVSLEDVFIDPEDMFATGKVNHFSHFGTMSSPGEGNEIYLPLVLRNYGG